MNYLILYLLQVIIASGILYGYYHFALRNNKFHRYNRFYLLAATIISIVIPFFNIPIYFSERAIQSSFVLQTLTTVSSNSGIEYSDIAIKEIETNWFSWKNLLLSIYILIGAIILIRIIISLLKLRRIINSNASKQLNNIRFINTDEPGTPFSFFKWLFWNNKIELNSEKGEQIFRHELFHIKQKHSWDVVYLELLTVLLWVNPFLHLIKRELKAVHEFLADEYAFSEDKKFEYAELLLMHLLNTKQRLVHPFFYNQIKRRIAMITTSKKASYQYLRKLMVLPVAVVLIAIFAFNYKEEINIDKNSVFITKEKIINDTSIKPSVNKITWVENFIPSQKKSPTTDQLKTWSDAKIYGIWLDNKRISNADLSRYAPADFALYNVSKLEKNAKNYGKHFYQVGLWTHKSYEKSQKNASATDKYVIVKDTTKPLLGTRFEKALIVVDGAIREDIKATELDKFLSINNIAAVTVIKDADATNKYGSKGENGVIEIITKRASNKEITNETENNTTIGIKDKIFTKVEIEPSFPGGEIKWEQYLENSLNKNTPIEKKSPAGIYSVCVEFIVRTDGSIINIKALTKHGYGMEGESIRIIKQGPKWIPAIQNGVPVVAYKKKIVTFNVPKK